jgi:hypothetical protein
MNDVAIVVPQSRRKTKQKFSWAHQGGTCHQYEGDGESSLFHTAMLGQRPFKELNFVF